MFSSHPIDTFRFGDGHNNMRVIDPDDCENHVQIVISKFLWLWATKVQKVTNATLSIMISMQPLPQPDSELGAAFVVNMLNHHHYHFVSCILPMGQVEETCKVIDVFPRVNCFKHLSTCHC